MKVLANWYLIFTISLVGPCGLLAHPLSSSEGTVIVAPEQNPAESKLRFFEDDPAFYTSLVTATDDVFRKSRGVIVLITGLGGNVESYGSAAQGTLTFCNSAIKRGLFPIVFENPIYFGVRKWGQLGNERQAIKERFGDLSSQLGWVQHSLGLVTQKLDLSRTGPGGKRLHLVGRSTGASLTFELLHRAHAGNTAAAQALNSVATIILAGLNSHRPGVFEKWTTAENVENEKKPKTMDLLANEVDLGLYKDMTFDSEVLQRLPGQRQTMLDLSLPLTIGMVAGQDHYLDFREQLEIIQRFSANHPGVRMVLTPTNGRHDPVASFEVDGKKIKNGAVLGELFDQVLDQKFESLDFRRGHPALHFFKHPLSPDPADICGISFGGT